MPMQRILGRSGIKVSAVGMGCWAIGGTTRAPVASGSGAFGWGEVDDRESIAAIHAALDAGVTFFETADVYGGGHSEKVLGQALVGRRHEVVLATKFGFAFDPYTRQMLGPETSPAYIRRACEGSLRRLQTDVIDLYQLHIGEYDPAYLDDICDVLERLVAAGTIRAYGWCTWADRLEGARVFAQRTHCASIQHPLNVLQDAPDMIAHCEAHHLASIANMPLAMSLLTGKFTAETRFPAHDVRHNWNFSSGPQAEQLTQVAALREILTADGRTLVQGALGWLWARSQVILPIPGFKTARQVQENAGAMHYGPLSEAQMQQIESVLGRSCSLVA